jgi:hypothetical protein
MDRDLDRDLDVIARGPRLIVAPITGAPAALACPRIWNVGYRKIGGIYFVKIGRLFFSFGVSRHYRPLHKEGNGQAV